MQRIEISKLWTMETPDGKTLLHGRFGPTARVVIEALPVPDENGATHAVFLLPPKEKKEGKRWPKQAKATPETVSPDGQLQSYCSWADTSL